MTCIIQKFNQSLNFVGTFIAPIVQKNEEQFKAMVIGSRSFKLYIVNFPSPGCHMDQGTMLYFSSMKSNPRQRLFSSIMQLIVSQVIQRGQNEPIPGSIRKIRSAPVGPIYGHFATSKLFSKLRVQPINNYNHSSDGKIRKPYQRDTVSFKIRQLREDFWMQQEILDIFGGSRFSQSYPFRLDLLLSFLAPCNLCNSKRNDNLQVLHYP